MLRRIGTALAKRCTPTPIECITLLVVFYFVWPYVQLTKAPRPSPTVDSVDSADPVTREVLEAPSAEGTSDELVSLDPSGPREAPASSDPTRERTEVSAPRPNLPAPELVLSLPDPPDPGEERVFSGRVVDDLGRPIAHFSVGIRSLGMPVMDRSTFSIPNMCQPPTDRNALPRPDHGLEYISMDGRFSYQVPRDAERRWLGLVAFTEVGGQRVESSPMPLDELIGGSDLKLTVRRGESIAGVVHSADGVPAGCQVTLAYTGHAPPRAMGGENDAFVPHVYQAHWVETTRAGAEGAFRFGGLPRGTFELRAALEGFASAPRSLRLTGAGTTTSTELTLVGTGSISVSIAVKEGVPVMIADAWYRPVHGESRELPICPVSGSSPGDGEGSTGPIPAGTYRVWWSTGDGAGFESTEVNVQRGFSTQLRISDSSGLAIDYVSEAALK